MDLLGDGAPYFAPLPSPYGEIVGEEVFDLAAYERAPGNNSFGYSSDLQAGTSWDVARS